MRKFLIVGLATVLMSTAAIAQHGHHGQHGGSNWVAPLIIGGVVGAVIANNRPTYIQPPVVYQQVPVYTYPSYTYQPMYKMVDVYIPECNCTRSIQVQVN